MAMISYIAIERPDLRDLDKIAGQLIYCTDSNDIFYDTVEGARMQIKAIIFETEDERTALEAPSEDRMYYVKESNLLYIHDGTAWKAVRDTYIVDEFIGDPTTLIPGTFTKEGVAYALRTLTPYVYALDGTPLSELLKNMVSKNPDPDAPPLEPGKIVIIDKDGNLTTIDKDINDLLDGIGSNVSTEVVQSGPAFPTSVNELGGSGLSSNNAFASGGVNNGTLSARLYNFNGVNWTQANNLLAGRYDHAASCTPSAVQYVIGGVAAGNQLSNTVEKIENGVVSVAAGNLVTARRGAVSVSGNTILGGETTTGEGLTTVETYNGTAWSVSSKTLLVPRTRAGISGITDNATIFGGTMNGTTNQLGLTFAETIDSITVSASPATLLTGRYGAATVGQTADSAYVYGGRLDASTPLLDGERLANDKFSVATTGLVARTDGAGAGAGSDAILFGGNINNTTFNLTTQIIKDNKLSTEVGNKMDKLVSPAGGRFVLSNKSGNVVEAPITPNDFAPSTVMVWNVSDKTMPGTKVAHGAGGSGADTLACGGKKTLAATATENICYRYNTTGWSAGANMLTARRNFGCSGSSVNNTIAAGGFSDATNMINTTETFNGTSWASGAALPAATAYAPLIGTNLGCIVVNGMSVADKNTGTNATYTYNGTAWSVGSKTMYDRVAHVGGGPATSAHITTGCAHYSSRDNLLNSENLNSGIWSIGTATPELKYDAAGSGNNSLDFGLMFVGGSKDLNVPTRSAFKYNGVAYVHCGNTIKDRVQSSLAANGGSNLLFGGSDSNTMEVITSKSTAQLVSGSTTSANVSVEAVGQLLTAAEDGSVIGTGKTVKDFTPSVASYNYMSGDFLAPRLNIAGMGSSNAMVAACGNDGGDVISNNAYAFNSVYWETTADANAARNGAAGCGEFNDALLVGGGNITTELFNGVTWENSADLLTNRSFIACQGDGSTDALVFGSSQNSEYYNGVTWETQGANIEVRTSCGGAGSSAMAIASGGKVNNASTHTTETCNFGTWSTSTSMPVAVDSHCGYGFMLDSIVAGGQNTGAPVDNVSRRNFDAVWSAVGPLLKPRAKYAGAGGVQTCVVAAGTSNGTSCEIETNKYSVTDTTDGVRIIDDCGCPIPEAALSARQGYKLKEELKNKLDYVMVDEDMEFIWPDE